MLDVRYDGVAREGYVRLRRGRPVRTRQLSEQAVAEYDRADRLLAISVSDLDARAAEFLRTADEETLLRVIREQAGSRKAGSQARPRPGGTGQARAGEPRDAAKPGRKTRPRQKPKARPATTPKAAGPKAASPGAAQPDVAAAAADAAPGDAAAPAAKRRRRRRRPPRGATNAPADA